MNVFFKAFGYGLHTGSLLRPFFKNVLTGKAHALEGPLIGSFYFFAGGKRDQLSFLRISLNCLAPFAGVRRYRFLCYCVHI